MTLAAVPSYPIRMATHHWDAGHLTHLRWATLGNVVALDATGEKFAWQGRLKICDGSASKTFSSSGGKIHWIVGTVVTWADGTTVVRIGIQDVTIAAAAVTPDGTFDVYDDITTADTLTASAVNTVIMSSGTKTMTDGVAYAVVFDMTTRGGSDILRVASHNVATGGYFQFPGSLGYTGAAWSGTGAPLGGFSLPVVLIEFDDGTFGILEGGTWMPAAVTTADTTSASNPDEYGMRFVPPFKARLWGVEMPLVTTAGGKTGTTGVLRLCSGTAASPSLVTSDNIDGFSLHANSSNAQRSFFRLTTPQTLTAGTTYYLTFRATDTQTWRHYYFGYPAAEQLASQPWGAGCYRVTREASTDGTGAFTEVTDSLYPAALLVDQLDDGAGAGASGGSTRVIGG